MFDLFYIIEVSDGWYNLCLKDTHYCMACGSDPNTLLATVGKYVKKYRTKEKFLRALSKTEDKGRHQNKITENNRKGLHDSATYYYDKEITHAITVALDEVKEDTAFNHIKKRKLTISLPTQKEEVKTPVKKDLPQRVGKPKILTTKPRLIRI